jgi:hypothetical protein
VPLRVFLAATMIANAMLGTGGGWYGEVEDFHNRAFSCCGFYGCTSTSKFVGGEQRHQIHSNADANSDVDININCYGDTNTASAYYYFLYSGDEHPLYS